MKPRADHAPGIVLEGDEELRFTAEALDFAETPLSQELNLDYANLLSRIYARLADVESNPPHNSKATDHVFGYLEPEASYIMDAIMWVAENHRDLRRAKQAAIMVRHFRLARFQLLEGGNTN